MFQKGLEPTTYRSTGKHATHTATEVSLAVTCSIPLLTHFSYLAAGGRLVVGIDVRLPARYTLDCLFTVHKTYSCHHYVGCRTYLHSVISPGWLETKLFTGCHYYYLLC